MAEAPTTLTASGQSGSQASNDLFNLGLRLQNLVGIDPTPESLHAAITELDTGIRRGIPTENAGKVSEFRASLINEMGKLVKVRQALADINAQSQAPGQLDQERVVTLEQSPSPGGGIQFAPPPGETGIQKGALVSSEPLPGTGKHFARGIFADAPGTSATPNAPQRLSPETLLRLQQGGAGGLIPLLEPRGAALTEEDTRLGCSRSFKESRDSAEGSVDGRYTRSKRFLPVQKRRCGKPRSNTRRG